MFILSTKPNGKTFTYSKSSAHRKDLPSVGLTFRPQNSQQP